MILNYDQRPLIDAQQQAPAGILDGRAVAGALREQVSGFVDQLKGRGVHPKLAVVQVGDDEASSIYIRHKIDACNEVGIRGEHHQLGGHVSCSKVRRRLQELNEDPGVHGILLQLPLPEKMSDTRLMRQVDPAKDVDGFHPVNLGCLMSRRSLLEPCTPTGVLTLLQTADVSPRGKQAVVIGRSVIVGRPMALMLTRADATVTTCHRHTRRLDELVRRADILVVATGVAELVKGDWIKQGAVVVDVGISRKDGKLCGDVEFDEAAERASLITPVPGGVGPMTVATVLENTVRAACIHNELIVRDGRVVSVEQTQWRYETTEGIGITTLVRRH